MKEQTIFFFGVILRTTTIIIINVCIKENLYVYLMKKNDTFEKNLWKKYGIFLLRIKSYRHK